MIVGNSEPRPPTLIGTAHYDTAYYDDKAHYDDTAHYDNTTYYDDTAYHDDTPNKVAFAKARFRCPTSLPNIIYMQSEHTRL